MKWKQKTDMLKNDLKVEYEVVASLKEEIAICGEKKEYDTRKILVRLPEDTEMAYLLARKKLRLNGSVGLHNYLSHR